MPRGRFGKLDRKDKKNKPGDGTDTSSSRPTSARPTSATSSTTSSRVAEGIVSGGIASAASKKGQPQQRPGTGSSTGSTSGSKARQVPSTASTTYAEELVSNAIIAHVASQPDKSSSSAKAERMVSEAIMSHIPVKPRTKPAKNAPSAKKGLVFDNEVHQRVSLKQTRFIRLPTTSSKDSNATSSTVTNSSTKSEHLVTAALMKYLKKFPSEGRKRRSSAVAEELVRQAISKAALKYCRQLCRICEDSDETQEECGIKGPIISFPNALHLLKLGIRKKTRVDLIRDRLPKLDICIPPKVPSWFFKGVKADKKCGPCIFYSRGKLGKPLHRCHHPFYTVEDELNQKRVVTAPYTALHDPHAKRFLYKPHVRKLLIKQNLINAANEVYCSPRDFTQFREYLETRRNDEVNNTLKKRDAMFLAERSQMQRIKASMSNKEGRQAFLNSRRIRSRALQRQARLNQRRKFFENETRVQFHLFKLKEEKAKQHLQKIVANREQEQLAEKRVRRVRWEELVWRRQILTILTAKDLMHQFKNFNDCFLTEIMDESTNQYRMDWLRSVLKYRKLMALRAQKIEESMREEIRENALKRQQRIELMRKLLPVIIEKKKAEERRVKDVVRKFAMRWLNKVRARLRAPKDALHESVWTGKLSGILGETIQYLKGISGYEKMDDLVFNILKLKQQIQKELDSEDEEPSGGSDTSGNEGSSSFADEEEYEDDEGQLYV